MSETKSLPVLKDAPVESVPLVSMTGRMIDKGGCFALAGAENRSTWLEMDRIPLHLIDHEVQVEGVRFEDLIVVRTIGPV